MLRKKCSIFITIQPYSKKNYKETYFYSKCYYLGIGNNNYTCILLLLLFRQSNKKIQLEPKIISSEINPIFPYYTCQIRIIVVSIVAAAMSFLGVQTKEISARVFSQLVRTHEGTPSMCRRLQSGGRRAVNPVDELPITWQLSLKPLSSTSMARYYCV